MLALLTIRWRKRAATLLVALYALCVVAPVAAFAASGGGTAPHCAASDYQGMANDHDTDAGRRQAVPGNEDHAGLVKCCGVFAVSAIAPDVDVVALPMDRASDVAMPPAGNLLGRHAGRIDRPPRVLTSL